jgi:hypothetical protein
MLAESVGDNSIAVYLTSSRACSTKAAEGVDGEHRERAFAPRPAMGSHDVKMGRTASYWEECQ